jgi:hypothetical protein
VGELGWAVAIGVVAALVGTGIRSLALALRPHVERRVLVLTPVLGLAMAALAIGFAEATDEESSLVLFSGQSAVGPVLADGTEQSAGMLVLLLACKGLAYSAALSGFRGGPVFPAVFLGAVGGLALAHLPGLGATAGAAMGMGAMTVTMLGLPLTSVLLAVLLVSSSGGLDAAPLVIVAVVVAYVTADRLRPRPLT